jgi:hypothetical protein
MSAASDIHHLSLSSTSERRDVADFQVEDLAEGIWLPIFGRRSAAFFAMSSRCSSMLSVLVRAFKVVGTSKRWTTSLSIVALST